MNNLSVIILTKDEEKNIERVIRSVEKISKDIVIVDSGSTDNTIKLLQKYNVRVFQKPLENFAKQRNFANSCTKNDWVLSLDADEEIPFDLKQEILVTLKNPEYDAYLIPRRNIIFGREIKHTRWSPDSHIWLYDKKRGEWKGEVHEEFVSEGKVGKLLHGKIHHSHKTVTDFLGMLNYYTDIESERIIKRGEKSTLFKMLMYSTKSFVGRFIFKRGFLDGYHGFVLSVLMGFYRFVTWAKVWEKQNK